MSSEFSAADLLQDVRQLTNQTLQACEAGRWDEATAFAKHRQQLLDVLFTLDLSGYEEQVTRLARTIEKADAKAVAGIQRAKGLLAGQLGQIRLGRKARDAYEDIQSHSSKS